MIKRQLLFIIIFSMFFFSCTNSFDLREQEQIIDNSDFDDNGNPISRTNIQISNNGPFPVDVFSDYTRAVKVNKDIILPGEYSPEIPWLPTSGTPYTFYITYYLDVYGVMIPYIPQGGVGTTTIHIPYNAPEPAPVQISDISASALIPSDQRLINDVGIILFNNYSSEAQLHRGTSVLTQNNSEVISIAPTKAGFYRVGSAASTAIYDVFASNIMLKLPETSLQAGYVYVFELTNSGQTSLWSSFELTMGNKSQWSPF